MNSHSELLDSSAYLAHAIEALHGATKRISLLALIACYDEATAEFFDAVIKAAERGVHVSIAADMFSYSELGGHFRLRSQFSHSIQPITELNKKLKRAKVKVHWLGNQATSIISGRTHSKWLVIDDNVYSFGGVNLYADGIRATDYMLHFNDTALADILCHEQQRIVAANRGGHSYRSHMYGDDKTRVLIDGGFVGDSLIYRRACSLIAEAAKVTYVSQYCPTGKIGRLLEKTDSTLYFNPSNQATSLNALAIRIGTTLSGLKTSYTGTRYVHCKCLIATFPDGSKRAITGSHNFSAAGVWLGTREVALETSDPHIIKQLERFIAHHIA